MKLLFAILILFASAAGTLYGANGETSSQIPDEEALTNMKYERDFLTGKRDEFIRKSGDLPVKDIVIRGLKKTAPSVVLSDIEIQPSEKLSLFDPHAAVNRLKKRNIFSEIDIYYTADNGSAIIEITVEEKWTLIPIPMVSSNRHGTKYGFYLMESNFLGYGKFLFAGGTYSTFGGTAMLGYIDPSIAGTRMRSNIFTTYKDEILQNGDTHGNTYREYRAAKKTARLDAGYNFSDSFRLFVSGGYESGEVNHSYEDSLNVPCNEKAWTAGTIARYEKIVHYEYLFYGPKLEASCIRHIPASDGYSGYTTAVYKFDYSFRVSGYDRLSVSSNGSAGDRPEIFEEMIGGKAGARTIPADIISADNFVNYTITYEYPYLRFRWGAVTLLAFWEQGVYCNNSTGTNRYYGPGAGMMLYLKQIALPAMGFNAANNLRTGSTEFSFSLGMSF